MGEYYQLGRRFRYERSLSFRNDQPIRHGDVGTVIEVRIRAVRQVDPVPLALVLPGLGELAVVGGRRIDEPAPAGGVRVALLDGGQDAMTWLIAADRVLLLSLSPLLLPRVVRRIDEGKRNLLWQ